VDEAKDTELHSTPAISQDDSVLGCRKHEYCTVATFVPELQPPEEIPLSEVWEHLNYVINRKFPVSSPSSHPTLPTLSSIASRMQILVNLGNFTT
jgi:hypothetical protein